MSMNSSKRSRWHTSAPLRVAAVIAVMLTACQPRPSIILTDTSCVPPCWRQIEPGRSTIREALTALSAIPELDTPVDDIAAVEQRGYEGWLFTSRVRESSGSVHFVGDRVTLIWFTLRNPLRLEELISRFGEPEQVSAISGWADSRWLNIAFLYPEKGVIARHLDVRFWPETRPAVIRPDLPIAEVIYFDPNLYDELLRSRDLIPEDYEIILGSLRPWRGFGETPYLDLSQR